MARYDQGPKYLTAEDEAAGLQKELVHITKELENISANLEVQEEKEKKGVWTTTVGQEVFTSRAKGYLLSKKRESIKRRLEELQSTMNATSKGKKKTA